MIAARLAALDPPRDAVAPPPEPMLATLGRRPFSGPGWLFELKYDGVRVLAARRGDVVDLLGRSGQVVTARYPEVVAALRALPVDQLLLDGELVAFGEDGKPSFQRLQARMGLTGARDVARMAARVPVVAVFFDCLAAGGLDLRRLPLRERKEVLRLLLPAEGAARFGDHVAEQGEALFAAADAAGLEGIVAKRAESPYTAGRSRDWIKLKCHRRQHLVIGGYTDPQGSRAHFGAIHLGRYERASPGPPRLVYVSKVGGGFDDAALRDVMERLRPLARATSPFAAGTPAGRGHHWVEPRLVCEVRYTEWTDEGGLRHPIFLGLRDDLAPEACRREG